MKPSEFDIIFVADPRFEGGCSTAMAVEIREAINAGFQCGLLMVRGPLIGVPFPTHPELRVLLDSGSLAIVDPTVSTRTDLVLIHHPSLLEHHFYPRPNVDAETVIVILHHPAFNNTGEKSYDADTILRHAKAAFGKLAKLAPVSNVVRKSLKGELQNSEQVLAWDWHNLIECSEWHMRDSVPTPGDIVIGRHSRPHPEKWPEKRKTALQCLPKSGVRSARILGGGTYLTDRYGHLPSHWDVLEFDEVPVKDFLQSIDFFV